MKHTLSLILLLFLTFSSLGAEELTSPNGNLKLSFENKDGIPVYSLTYKGLTVLGESRLGIKFENADMTSGFTMTSVSRSTFDEVWTPVWGQYAKIRNNYNEMCVKLVQKGENGAEENGKAVMICFRLFDDGLGFRYEFPRQEELNYVVISDEMTQFQLPGDLLAFCIPGDYDSNEFAISTARISNAAAEMEKNLSKKYYESKAEGGLTVQTPLMLKSDDGLYINIHEASLVNYSAMLLNVDDRNFSLTAHLTPDKLGKKGYLQLPFNTPWRTVIVSDDARDILASSTILNLNEPCAFEDVSWIKPTKFMGVWWEMFIGAGGTWSYCDDYKAKPGITDYTKETPSGHHAANTANVKKYIDFASENGIGALLVEGWNEGWEDWASYVKDRQFLFDKPYPDFDVEEIHNYAASKGVQMIMHHETSSNAADYERQMDRAFQFMVDNGYHAVKTGYVGYIIPRTEYHSSQWMNEHYVHVASRAADFHIMIDSHEAVRPTGLCRTYPNWIAQESARGGEFEAFGGSDCDHTTILPFTRLMGGPMDYTPGIFQTDLSYYKGTNNSKARTTLVKQMALYVTMPSPLQMAADLPENYARFMDAFQFIKDVAVDWDNSWYLEAEPGDYITAARKAKGKDEWFIGAITDENPRTAVIDFSFLPEGKYTATIYEDGKDADWDTNPQSYNIRTIKVTPKTVLKQKLASSGGAAITVRPAAK